MNCPHRRMVGKGQIVHCQLVDIGTPVAVDPCWKCQSESGGKVPTLDSMTPTLETMVGKFSGKPIPRETVKPPPMLTRIMNFAAAFARHVAAGGKTLPKAESKERLAICDKCPHRISVLGCRVCGLCGCALALKSTWPEQSCPIKLWPGDADKPPCGSPCGQTVNAANPAA